MAHKSRIPTTHVVARRRVVVGSRLEVRRGRRGTVFVGEPGEGGHGGGGGEGRPHEYYHPKTPEEIGIATEWRRLERKKAEAETLLRSLEGQRGDWERHYRGVQGLVRGSPEGGPKKPPIRTWRVSSPTPYGESYMELRKDIAKLNRLPAGSEEIEKIRLEKPGAYQLWQLQHTRGMRFRNVLWSMSLKRGLHAVANGWERFTKHFGFFGGILNWPVKIAIGLLAHPLKEIPTGPFDLANPDSQQFAVREKASPNLGYEAHKIAVFKGDVQKAAEDLADANAQMAAIAQQHEWVHKLPHAGGH